MSFAIQESQFTPNLVPPFSDFNQRLGDKNYSVVTFLYHESKNLSSKKRYFCRVLYSYACGNVHALKRSFAARTTLTHSKRIARGFCSRVVSSKQFLHTSKKNNRRGCSAVAIMRVAFRFELPVGGNSNAAPHPQYRPAVPHAGYQYGV